jgi:hypothetical protein
MALTKGGLLQPQPMTTAGRDSLALAGIDSGRLIYNLDAKVLQVWDGNEWLDVAAGSLSVDAENIVGEITNDQIESIEADKITGLIQNDQIEELDASKITGLIKNDQIESLDAAKLYGTADGGVY